MLRSWSHLAQESLEVAAFKQLQDDVVRTTVEADAQQLHDVRVIEFADNMQQQNAFYLFIFNSSPFMLYLLCIAVNLSFYS